MDCIVFVVLWGQGCIATETGMTLLGWHSEDED